MGLAWKQFKKKEVLWGLFAFVLTMSIFVFLSPDGGEHSFEGALAEYLWGEEQGAPGTILTILLAMAAMFLTQRFVGGYSGANKKERRAIRFGFLSAMVVLLFFLLISPDNGEHNIMEIFVEKFLEDGNLFIEVVISIAFALGAYHLTKRLIMRKN